MFGRGAGLIGGAFLDTLIGGEREPGRGFGGGRGGLGDGRGGLNGFGEGLRGGWEVAVLFLNTGGALATARADAGTAVDLPSATDGPFAAMASSSKGASHLTIIMPRTYVSY